MKNKVLLAFSGGIDSCHAVGVLQAEGYEVHALTMNMTGDAAITDKARQKAAELGITYTELDVCEQFSDKIIDYFAAEYRRGCTPAPCTLCNYHIKWKYLYEYAVANGFDKIATGHYFRIQQEGGKYYVTKGADPIKDQSYYLWQLPQHILSMVLTPLGDKIKQQVKDSLPPQASRRESMGVCFLRGLPYQQYLREHQGFEVCAGPILDKHGRRLGTHDGVAYYTIGQKKGLGLPTGYCVVGIDAQANTLVAGEDKDLYSSILLLSNCNVVDMEEVLTAKDISVKIRGLGRNPEGFCRVSREGDRLRIELADRAWACAPGQPVVLYRGAKVIGGGILEKYF